MLESKITVKDPRLDYPVAKTGETVNGGAESAVHLDR